MEQYIREVLPQYELDEDAPLRSRKSTLPPVEESPKNSSCSFDCNICLDPVQDPVVTFCGHLYCWPCIYKWIHFESFSCEKPDDQEPRCPVCKSELSEKTLVPLYGRDLGSKSLDKNSSDRGLVIPQRPQTPRCATSLSRTASNSLSAQQLHLRTYPQLHQQYQPYTGSYMAHGTGTNVSQPVFGMLGDVMYSRMFGNPGTTLYTYPNSHQLSSSTNRRMRRRIMAVDRSLNRICFFLFCCTVLCLLLF